MTNPNKISTPPILIPVSSVEAKVTMLEMLAMLLDPTSSILPKMVVTEIKIVQAR